MDDRYFKNGYNASFIERPYGAIMTVRKDGHIIAELAVGYGFVYGKHPSVVVKFMQDEEFRNVFAESIEKLA